MPVTPNFSIPYPSLSDAPNGPVQMGALATAVDGALVTLTASTTTAAAEIDATWKTVKTTIVTTTGNIHDDIAGTEVPILKLSTTAVPITLGRIYRFRVRLFITNPTVVADDFVIRVRRGSTAGTEVAAQANFVARTLVDHVFTLDHLWIAPTGNASDSFHPTLQRVVGTGVADVFGQSNTWFEISTSNTTRVTNVP